MGKQGALNSNLGSVSGVMESMVNYLDGKFAEIHKKLELQDSQMKQISAGDCTDHVLRPSPRVRLAAAAPR